MAMIGGGDAVMENCRTVDIMSDAAHIMLCKDSKTFTGNFCVDEDVLKEAGVTDLDKYSCVPGQLIETKNMAF